MKNSKLILIFLAVFLFGCKNEMPNVDENSFSDSKSIPFVNVPREELPDWLNEWIDQACKDFVGLDWIQGPAAEVYRGTWKGKTIYQATSSYSSAKLNFFDENGEVPNLTPSSSPPTTIDVRNWDWQKMYPETKDWVLIFQIVDGVIVDGATVKSSSSTDNTKIVDKYHFPDISKMNDWERPTIIQDRLAALQIPDAVLASISTEGLLETCLDFPYLIDIFHANDYQTGFNALVEEFNGFREILKRSDLTTALIGKYNRVGTDVKGLRMLNIIEQGMFSFRHFVLEFMLAQDVVLNNLNKEQEETLFLLTVEHKKIKSSYTDIFSSLNDVPVNLLYAKKILSDNQAGADMKNTLLEFTQAPRYIEQNVISYLDDYINVKSK